MDRRGFLGALGALVAARKIAPAEALPDDTARIQDAINVAAASPPGTFGIVNISNNEIVSQTISNPGWYANGFYVTRNTFDHTHWSNNHSWVSSR